MVILAAAVCLVTSTSSIAERLTYLLMFWPALQLAASFVTLIWLLTRGADNASLRTLGRITVWSVLGALAGVLLMAGCAMILLAAP
jgi:hypothetical protein